MLYHSDGKPQRSAFTSAISGSGDFDRQAVSGSSLTSVKKGMKAANGQAIPRYKSFVFSKMLRPSE
jgi:hypothetical protein